MSSYCLVVGDRRTRTWRSMGKRRMWDSQCVQMAVSRPSWTQVGWLGPKLGGPPCRNLVKVQMASFSHKTYPLPSSGNSPAPLCVGVGQFFVTFGIFMFSSVVVNIKLMTILESRTRPKETFGNSLSPSSSSSSYSSSSLSSLGPGRPAAGWA